jgi:hypothetical protein
MAHVERSRSWTVRGEVGTVRDQVRRFCHRFQLHVCEDRGQMLVAEKGSRFLTRLFGGWFVPFQWLPIRATVQFSSTAEGEVAVRALFEDAIGFGFMDPWFEKKYQRYFADWLEELQDCVCGDD